VVNRLQADTYGRTRRMPKPPVRGKQTRAERKAARERNRRATLAARAEGEAVLVEVMLMIVDRARELFGPEPEDGYSEAQLVECIRQLEDEERACLVGLGKFQPRFFS
jgi:hypothetical protein